MKEEFLSVQEVSNWLGLDPQTIRRKIKEGKIKAVRIDDYHKSRFRISISDVREFLKKRGDKL